MTFELTFFDNILSFIVLVLLGVGFAFAARRMLSVPVGWPRSIILGMILFNSIGAVVPWIAEASGISEATTRTTTEIVAAVSVLLLVLAWGFFLCIAALVVLELIIPTGSLGTPWGWVRTIRDRNRRTRRYLQVLAIATRNGLGSFLGSSTTRRERDPRAQQLGHGPSTAQRAERGWRHLHQDRADAVQPTRRRRARCSVASCPTCRPHPLLCPGRNWKPVLAASQSRPLSEIFAEIESRAARRGLGRPGAHRQVDHRRVGGDQDPEAEGTGPGHRRSRHRAAVGAAAGEIDPVGTQPRRGRHGGRLRASLREELDYRIEVDNTQAVAASDPDSELKIPHVYEELCTSSVLVLERLSGIPLGSASGAARRACRPSSARILADRLLGGRAAADHGRRHLPLRSAPGQRAAQSRRRAATARLRVGRAARRRGPGSADHAGALDRSRFESRRHRRADGPDGPAGRCPSTTGGWNARSASSWSGSGAVPGAPAGCSPSCSPSSTAGDSAYRRRSRPFSVRWPSLEGTLRLLDPSLNLVVSARRHGEELLRALDVAQLDPRAAGDRARSAWCPCSGGFRGDWTRSPRTWRRAGWPSASACWAMRRTGVPGGAHPSAGGGPAGLRHHRRGDRPAHRPGRSDAVTRRIGFYQLLGFGCCSSAACSACEPSSWSSGTRGRPERRAP